MAPVAALRHDANAPGLVAADGLAALYDYAQRRLLEANAGNQTAPLQEVDALLADIETAWNSIGQGQPHATVAGGAA